MRKEPFYFGELTPQLKSSPLLPSVRKALIGKGLQRLPANFYQQQVRCLLIQGGCCPSESASIGN